MEYFSCVLNGPLGSYVFNAIVRGAQNTERNAFGAKVRAVADVLFSLAKEFSAETRDTARALSKTSGRKCVRTHKKSRGV